MFFFFNFNDFKKGDDVIAPSLVADSFSANNNDIRELLLKEAEKQGLRNADIAQLTGWTPSKTSKLCTGKQKLTVEDIKTWARALGYTPDPFIDPSNIDIRYYNLRAYIRNTSDTLEAYFEHFGDSDPEHSSTIRYELPLSILATLGVTPSDYAVRCTPSYSGLPDSGLGIGGATTCVRFWHRNVSTPETARPEFGLWLSPENDHFILAVYINRNCADGSLQHMRSQYKDILQVDEEETREFDEMAREFDWIPRDLKQGEIVSIVGDTNELPGPESMNDTLIGLFKWYCKLVWEMKGIDLLPNHLKKTEEEELSPCEQYEVLNNTADFDVETKEAVLKRENYKCENNESHTTFTDATGRTYMDVVPLIPFIAAGRFGKASKSEVNGLCLCPICAKQLKYGSLNDREDMIYKLYRKHQKKLEQKGIDMPLTQVLAANGLG